MLIEPFQKLTRHDREPEPRGGSNIGRATLASRGLRDGFHLGLPIALGLASLIILTIVF